MTATHLFAAQQASRARDKAVEQVSRGVSPEWAHAALRAVYKVCRRRLRDGNPEFTTDATVAQLQADGHGDPPEPRAWGHVMRTAQRRGWCSPTGRMVPSTDVTNHRRKKEVWRVNAQIPDWDGL